MKQAFLTKFDRLMAAVTFAEAGEFETAREMMKEEKRTDRHTQRPEMRKQQTARRPNLRAN